MKKQLFILMMAIFALSLNVNSQVTCPAPRAVDVTCLPADALHPVAGTPYNYEVVVPTPPGTKEFTWFVTQDQQFINAGVLTANRELNNGTGLHIAATGTGYNNPATGAATLSITWKSFVYDPLNPVFVVIQVKNQAPAAGCLSQNMKVFKIQPLNAFTLDIANMTAAGAVSAYETGLDKCIHDIVSATYDATTPEGVVYDFGSDTLLFVVTAANFSNSWLPSIQLSGVDAQETITAVEWAYSTDLAFATPHTMTLGGGIYVSVDSVDIVSASGFVGAAGECILVRVIVDHSNALLNYEGLADEPIAVAVDGVTSVGSVSIPDVHFSATLPAVNALCGLEDGFTYDIATQTIKARPDITAAPAMPAPGLLPVKP